MITHTWTQGGAGKIRTAMKMSGGEELYGVKELRTIAKTGPVHRGEGKNRVIDPTLQKTAISSLQDIKEEVALMEKFKSKINRYVMREIAADLEACHKAGYVHNDLKFLNTCFKGQGCTGRFRSVPEDPIDRDREREGLWYTGILAMGDVQCKKFDR